MPFLLLFVAEAVIGGFTEIFPFPLFLSFPWLISSLFSVCCQRLVLFCVARRTASIILDLVDGNLLQSIA